MHYFESDYEHLTTHTICLFAYIYITNGDDTVLNMDDVLLDQRINARLGAFLRKYTDPVGAKIVPPTLLASPTSPIAPPAAGVPTTPVLGAVPCPYDGVTACIAAPKPKTVVDVTCTNSSATQQLIDNSNRRRIIWSVLLMGAVGALLVWIILTLVRNRRQLSGDSTPPTPPQRTTQHYSVGGGGTSTQSPHQPPPLTPPQQLPQQRDGADDNSDEHHGETEKPRKRKLSVALL